MCSSYFILFLFGKLHESKPVSAVFSRIISVHQIGFAVSCWWLMLYFFKTIPNSGHRDFLASKLTYLFACLDGFSVFGIVLKMLWKIFRQCKVIWTLIGKWKCEVFSVHLGPEVHLLWAHHYWHLKRYAFIIYSKEL